MYCTFFDGSFFPRKDYDLIIEGVSLVKNYRTQFREIIARGSPEKLLNIFAV
jgi:phospholipid transport system substrate-binding protein